MKPEHLKLAGIVTMVCGGMSSLGVGATGTDSPTVASGRIIPMQSAPQAATMGTMDAAAQDTAAVTPDAASDPAPALDAPTMSAEADVPVAASAESEDAQTVHATIALAGDATPVTVSLASNVAHVADVADVADVEHVADVPGVADVAHEVDVPARPATDGVQRARASLKLGGTVDVVNMPAHHMQLADTGAHATDAAVERHPAAPRTAQTDDADPAWASADLVAVNDNRLDNMRGGFDMPSGLVVSFGISREAFVNGNLVASTSFNIPNIAQMTPQQAQMLANANAGALVQNGLNNTVQTGALPGLTGAVIQNSLSNQQIQALTTINTTVNSLGAFKALNLGQTLNSALLSAVRPR